MVKRYLACVLLFFALMLFAQQDVVAVVNGRNITMDEWNREANVQKLLIDIQNSNETFYQVLTTTQEGMVIIEKYKLRVLDILIRKIAFIQFAESLKVAPDASTVKNDVDTEIKKMINDLKMTESQLNDYLIQLGMGSLEDYKQRLYLQRTYSLSLANVLTYYIKNISISDEEIKAYYEKNQSKYFLPTQYDLIVFKTKDKNTADNIRLDLAKNLPSSEISKKYSVQPLVDGFVNQGDTSKIPQNLWLKITNTPKNTILPTESISGEYYVIKLRDVKVGGQKSLDDAKEEIKKQLLSVKQDEAKDKISKDFDEFFKKSKIEIKYKSQIVK
ncbi:MAG: peptidyl-prolyl cis-trans isomerase [Fervidobacterium sp.]